MLTGLAEAGRFLLCFDGVKRGAGSAIQTVHHKCCHDTERVLPPSPISTGDIRPRKIYIRFDPKTCLAISSTRSPYRRLLLLIIHHGHQT